LQRNNIGQLLGKIRDLENDLPEDGVQRIVTENTTLKQQVACGRHSPCGGGGPRRHGRSISAS
jgi:hypothetical protein